MASTVGMGLGVGLPIPNSIGSAFNFLTGQSSIDQFRGYLNNFTDIAHANRYSVIFGPVGAKTQSYPPFMRKYTTGSVQGLSFQCENAELPGRNFSTYEARTYGPWIKYPSGTSYNDLSLTFFCTGNPAWSTTNLGLWEKRFFDDWMDYINPSMRGGNFNIEYRDNYTSTIVITHYDIMGTPGFDNMNNNMGVTYQAIFYDTWPLAMDHIPLSFQDDSGMKLTVTFGYSKWEYLPPQQAFGSEVLNILSAAGYPASTYLNGLNKNKIGGVGAIIDNPLLRVFK